MGAKKKKEHPSFDSEDSILDYDFDPEEIFSSPDHVSQVPESVLDFYCWSDQDKVWVNNKVSRELQGRWVSWDNKEAVLRYLVEDAEQIAERYFKERFALFNHVEYKFIIVGHKPSLMGRIWGEETIQGFYTRAFTNKRRELVEELKSLIETTSKEQLNAQLQKAYGLTPEDWKVSVGNRWQPLGPRPIIPPGGLTPKEAETYVAQMLRFYGLAGTKVTRYSQDGGVDVESTKGVFQVKHQKAPVGVGVVREILGVATSKGKRAGVFAKTGFTKEATEFAERNGILLFSYTPSFQGRTKIAEGFVNSGFEKF